MLVSCVHPVAILRAVFCIICSLSILVSDALGDHMVEAYSSTCLVMALYVASMVSLCFEVMGPHCLISEEEVAAAIKGLKFGKAAGPTGVVSEMMKAAGGFGSRWMTDLINNIVKEGYIPDDWRKSILVHVYKVWVIQSY